MYLTGCRRTLGLWHCVVGVYGGNGGGCSQGVSPPHEGRREDIQLLFLAPELHTHRDIDDQVCSCEHSVPRQRGICLQCSDDDSRRGGYFIVGCDAMTAHATLGRNKGSPRGGPARAGRRQKKESFLLVERFSPSLVKARGELRGRTWKKSYLLALHPVAFSPSRGTAGTVSQD